MLAFRVLMNFCVLFSKIKVFYYLQNLELQSELYGSDDEPLLPAEYLSAGNNLPLGLLQQ